MDLLACIGDDIFAEMATSLYRREGISPEHIHRIPNVNTGVGFVTLLPSGENWIVGHLGANMHMRPDHVDAAEDLIARSDIYHIRHILSQGLRRADAVSLHRTRRRQ